MVYRLLTALTFISTTAVGTILTGGSATEASIKSTSSYAVTETAYLQEAPDVYTLMLSAQQETKKVGSVQFWEAVSWCETNHKWNDGGYYSGGLGMAQSVWENYGGRQFATRPSKATKVQQIIVANRVAFLGFQTRNIYRTLDDKLNNRPYFKPAVGWRSMKNWGRNCVNWRTRQPLRDRYTQSN